MKNGDVWGDMTERETLSCVVPPLVVVVTEVGPARVALDDIPAAPQARTDGVWYGGTW